MLAVRNGKQSWIITIFCNKISIISTLSPNKMLHLDENICNKYSTIGTEMTGGTSSNFTHDHILLIRIF
jgi:hypothetical protein